MSEVFGVQLSPGELWSGLVTIVVAVAGSGALVAWLNRSKTNADAHLTAAQRQQLQDDIADGLRKDLLDADENCDKRIKRLEAEREADRLQCDAKLAALAEKLAALELWGKQAERESCERTSNLQEQVRTLQAALADERDLRLAREEELDGIMETLKMPVPPEKLGDGWAV